MRQAGQSPKHLQNRDARFRKLSTSFSVPKLPVSDRHRGLSGGNGKFGVIFQAESGDFAPSSNRSPVRGWTIQHIVIPNPSFLTDPAGFPSKPRGLVSFSLAEYGGWVLSVDKTPGRKWRIQRTPIPNPLSLPENETRAAKMRGLVSESRPRDTSRDTRRNGLGARGSSRRGGERRLAVPSPWLHSAQPSLPALDGRAQLDRTQLPVPAPGLAPSGRLPTVAHLGLGWVGSQAAKRFPTAGPWDLRPRWCLPGGSPCGRGRAERGARTGRRPAAPSRRCGSGRCCAASPGRRAPPAAPSSGNPPPRCGYAR